MLGAASLILFHVPSLAVALLASALIGISNGTANPAGADVLQRYTPEARRNFVFSIKQAGVPLGGVVAGLTIPPLIETFGWRSALVIAAAGTLAATALMLPFRARIDGPRERVPRSRMSLADLAVPLRSLTAAPGLLRVSIAGAVFSVAQSCWFTFAVTYLVIAHGLSLGVAGLVFAVMQAFGVAGRILMGWIADNVVEHGDARLRGGGVGRGHHPVRALPAGLAGVEPDGACRRRRRLGVRLERRADRRGRAPLAAPSGRRDRGRLGDPGVLEQHAGAGRLRGVRRRDRSIRRGVHHRRRVQSGVFAAVVGD